MKTIATVIASLLLSLGLLVAPASAAEDAAPPSCEDTAQEWRTRALAAEAELEQYRTTLAGTVDLLYLEKAQVASANVTIERAARIINRRGEKIAKLRKMVRQLRRSAR